MVVNTNNPRRMVFSARGQRILPNPATRIHAGNPQPETTQFFADPSPAVLPARVFLGENWARTGSRKALFLPSSRQPGVRGENSGQAQTRIPLSRQKHIPAKKEGGGIKSGATHGRPFRPKYLQLIHGCNVGRVTFPQFTGKRSPDNSRTKSAAAILPI